MITRANGASFRSEDVKSGTFTKKGVSKRMRGSGENEFLKAEEDVLQLFLASGDKVGPMYGVEARRIKAELEAADVVITTMD